MKLSEAIRLGAMVRPQGFGDLWVGGAVATAKGIVETAVHSCALGAAYDALGCGWNDSVSKLMPDAVATQLLTRARCPACDRRPVCSSLQQVIAHLNDRHRWTRERIADWVASQEAPRVPPSIDASDPHVIHPGNLATRV